MWIDDVVLNRCNESIALNLWIPKSNMVVLGNANLEEKECYVETCKAQSIPILKRYGGGGTVVLHPGCVVLSLGAWVKDYYSNDKYFRSLNEAVIASLASHSDKFSQLAQRGISDLAYLERKMAGSSLFRSRNYLLFQISILVDDRIALIEELLRHPPKEPDYRKGKSHRDFLTSLNQIVPSVTSTQILSNLYRHYVPNLRHLLGSELIASKMEQVSHLRHKIEDKESDSKLDIAAHMVKNIHCEHTGEYN